MDIGNFFGALKEAGHVSAAHEVRGRMGGSMPGGARHSADAATRHLHSVADIAETHRAETQSGTRFGFADLVDIVNPLHHVPVLGSAYREMTGDEIHPASRLIGGAVFGGAVGAVGGLVNMAVTETTGKDLGGHIMGMVMPDKSPAGGFRVSGDTGAQGGTRAERRAQWDAVIDALPARRQMTQLDMPSVANLKTSSPKPMPETELKVEPDRAAQQYAENARVQARYVFNS